MKRTLLAVGVAVLMSMLLIPRDYRLFNAKMWLPFFLDAYDFDVLWRPFVLQTIFATVAAALAAWTATYFQYGQTHTSRNEAVSVTPTPSPSP